MVDKGRASLASVAAGRCFFLAFRGAVAGSVMMPTASFAQTAEVKEDYYSTQTCAGLTLTVARLRTSCWGDTKEKIIKFNEATSGITKDLNKYRGEICSSKYDNLQYPEHFVDAMQTRVSHYNSLVDQFRSQTLACASDDSIIETLKQQRDEAWSIKEFLKSIYSEVNRGRFAQAMLQSATAFYEMCLYLGSPPSLPTGAVKELAEDIGGDVVADTAHSTAGKGVPEYNIGQLTKLRYRQMYGQNPK